MLSLWSPTCIPAQHTTSTLDLSQKYLTISFEPLKKKKKKRERERRESKTTQEWLHFFFFFFPTLFLHKVFHCHLWCPLSIDALTLFWRWKREPAISLFACWWRWSVNNNREWIGHCWFGWGGLHQLYPYLVGKLSTKQACWDPNCTKLSSSSWLMSQKN